MNGVVEDVGGCSSLMLIPRDDQLSLIRPDCTSGDARTRGLARTFWRAGARTGTRKARGMTRGAATFGLPYSTACMGLRRLGVDQRPTRSMGDRVFFAFDPSTACTPDYSHPWVDLCLQRLPRSTVLLHPDSETGCRLGDQGRNAALRLQVSWYERRPPLA